MFLSTRVRCYVFIRLHNFRICHSSALNNKSDSASMEHSEGITMKDQSSEMIVNSENTTCSNSKPLNETFVDVSEGKAVISFPNSETVFYNPVQEFNRDLSIAVMKNFIKSVHTTARGVYTKLRNKNSKIEINVLEALAASGLRSIRYAKEIDGIQKIVANDMSRQAYESMLYNIKKNGVEHIVEPMNDEAMVLMYKNKKKFDIVDLDPYGTCGPFVDAAVQSVVDGGLLMVTCTDMAVLCGNGPETCHAKYGAISTKDPACKEMALRIVLQCIESNANKYGRYIEPILSVSADFYVRLFVKIFSGLAKVKTSITKLSNVYICQSCSSYYLQPLGELLLTEKGSKYLIKGPPVDRKCDICDGSFKVCGPIWSANIHDKEFILSTLQSIEQEQTEYKTSKRMLGMLNVILEELDDCPLYHRIEKLCSQVHVRTPTILQIRSAFLNAGYKISLSHTSPSAIKTNAPQRVVWDIIRTWAKLNHGKKTFVCEPSKFIMSKEPSIEVSFEERADANPESRTHCLLRFQLNPEPFWGPKSRAKINTSNEPESKKSNKNKLLEKKLEPKCKKMKSEDYQNALS